MAASDAAHMTKKCPHCFTYLPLPALRCNSCGKPVGPVTRLGLAQKVIDWRSYLAAALAILAFSGFLWWGFFTE
jgi:hypothetical protein